MLTVVREQFSLSGLQTHTRLQLKATMKLGLPSHCKSCRSGREKHGGLNDGGQDNLSSSIGVTSGDSITLLTHLARAGLFKTS